jgi:hypothetical protein
MRAYDRSAVTQRMGEHAVEGWFGAQTRLRSVVHKRRFRGLLHTPGSYALLPPLRRLLPASATQVPVGSEVGRVTSIMET